MVRIRKFLMVGTLACLGIFSAGCNSEKVLELQKEVDRLNVIKMNYEKDVRELMETIDRNKVELAQYKAEIIGKDKQIALLLEELHRAPVSGNATRMTDSMSQRIRILAEEVGGELIGNRILLPGDFLFASGSWALTDGARSTLKKISQVLDPESMGLVLKIVGHTDNEPIKHLKSKGVDSNLQLSLRRSVAVLEYLKSSCQYPAELMYPTGWGELDPLADNSTAGGRKKNRRVEIFIDSELSNLTSSSGISGITVEPAADRSSEDEKARKSPAPFTK